MVIACPIEKNVAVWSPFLPQQRAYRSYLSERTTDLFHVVRLNPKLRRRRQSEIVSHGRAVPRFLLLRVLFPHMF